MVTSLTPDGKNFMGEAQGNEHTYGKIVKSLIDEGGSIRSIFKRYGFIGSKERWLTM